MLFSCDLNMYKMLAISFFKPQVYEKIFLWLHYTLELLDRENKVV